MSGTCEWVRKDEALKCWLESDPNLLWICGGPGKGKTMLSIYPTQKLAAKFGDDVIYHFCSSEDEKRNRSTAVLRTLIWQMVTKQPALARLVTPYFNLAERVGAVLASPGFLWQILLRLTMRRLRTGAR